MRSTGKILRGAAIVVGVLVFLLALAGFLVPRIANVDAVRAAIEQTIAKELGGKVTFGKVDLALLPHPEIEIRNVNFEIPGSFSGSVAAAGVSVRLLPLLRGRFAVESATLDHPALVVTLPAPTADVGKSPSPGSNPASRSLGKLLTVSSRAVPDLSLKISGGSLSLVREGRTALSLGELEAQLAFVPVQEEGRGTPAGQPDARFHLAGEAQAVIGQRKPLPGPIRISIGRFDAVPESLAVAGARAQILDMDLTLDGSIGDYLGGEPRVDVVANGSIGPGAAAWMGTRAGLPAGLTPRATFKIANARLRSSGKGPASSWGLTGSLAVPDGPTIPFEVRQEPGLLTLESLRVKDGASDVLLTGAAGEKEFDCAFSGRLEGSTLMRLFDRERVPFGSIKGDIRIHAPRGRWWETTAEGTLEGSRFVLPAQFAGALAVEVDRFLVQAGGRTLRLRAATVALGGRTAEDVELAVSIVDGRTTMDLERGSVCGIPIAGRLRIDDRDIDIALQPRARGRKLEEDLRCLFGWDLPPTGTYDLSGSLSARGSRATLRQSLQGSFDAAARKGSIRNASVVEGVLAYLEKTSVLDDAEAARMREGVPYESIALRGTLRDGGLEFANLAVKSKVMQVAAEGGVDLRGRTLALKVLVAPLRGVDRFLSKVPLVRRIAGDALVVVPVRVEGPFDKPEVKHLPASGLGASVVNLMKNIVQAPVQIVEPLSPGGAE